MRLNEAGRIQTLCQGWVVVVKDTTRANHRRPPMGALHGIGHKNGLYLPLSTRAVQAVDIINIRVVLEMIIVVDS